MAGRIDVALRFAYAVIAPFALVVIAQFLPISGALLSAALATAIAVFGTDRWIAYVGNVPLLGAGLRGMAGLGEFYREHPPKPLLYYVLFPLLLPYWLINRIARAEFLMYRRLGLLSLAIVVATAVVDYLRYWRPDLSVEAFCVNMFAGVVLQLIVTFALVMPMVTTVLVFKQRGTGLRALMVIAAVSGLLGIVGRGSDISLMTWKRVQERMKVATAEFQACVAAHGGDRSGCKDRAGSALHDALDEAHAALASSPADVDGALARAQVPLGRFFKSDEVDGFRLYVAEGIEMLHLGFSHDAQIWVARDATHALTELAQLPPGARDQLANTRAKKR